MNSKENWHGRLTFTGTRDVVEGRPHCNNVLDNRSWLVASTSLRNPSSVKVKQIRSLPPVEYI